MLQKLAAEVFSEDSVVHLKASSSAHMQSDLRNWRALRFYCIGSDRIESNFTNSIILHVDHSYDVLY